MQLLLLAEILALAVLGFLILRDGGNSRWVMFGAATAILAPALQIASVITWHTVGVGRPLVVGGMLLLPFASLLIFGVSRRLESRRWRLSGMALGVSWAAGSVGVLSLSWVLAVLFIPALALLPIWMFKVVAEMAGRRPGPPSMFART